MYQYLFFDLDQTIAPSRQPILPEMYELLANAKQTIIIVSGQSADKISWQSNDLPAYVLGQNGNHALDPNGQELWNNPLSPVHKAEILSHIAKLSAAIDHPISQDWNPIEDRGSQITFSPIGNTAPVEIKQTYDPDRQKRERLLADIPFESEDLIVKIGGSTSIDYIHKDLHKGTNVARLIELQGWPKAECIYYGDGLFPGGNDEAVIGVIDTVSVTDHLDTFKKVSALLDS